MDIKDDNLNRRGSLAISALLNDDTTTHHKQSTGDLSPVLSSGTTSPIMGASSGSQLSKAKRKRISPAQYNRLMEIFDQTDTPSSEIRENLADELDMTKREVQVWFQNRRAKMSRTKNLQGKHHCHSLTPTTNSSIPKSNQINVNNNNTNSIGFYQVKSRRSSAYSVLENNKNIHKPQTPYPPVFQQPLNSGNGRYPIAPMPSVQRQEHGHYNKASTLPHQHHHSVHHPYHPYRYQRKPSAIDLLASAAEYVRSDSSNEMAYFRT